MKVTSWLKHHEELDWEEGKDLAAAGKDPWTGRLGQDRQPLLTPPMPAAGLPGHRTALLILWGKPSKYNTQLLLTQSLMWVEEGQVSIVPQIGIDPQAPIGDKPFNGTETKFYADTYVLSNTTDAFYKLWLHLVHSFNSDSVSWEDVFYLYLIFFSSYDCIIIFQYFSAR